MWTLDIGQDSRGPQFWVALPEVTLCTTFSLVLVPIRGKRCRSSQGKQLDTMWGPGGDEDDVWGQQPLQKAISCYV